METIPSGIILKNGAKPIHNIKYTHPLDGHGFINKFTVTSHGIKHKGIRVKTHQYKVEKEQKKLIYKGLGTNSDNWQPCINNFNNVSVSYVNDKIFSHGEGGFAHEIDIESGETLNIQHPLVIPEWIAKRMPFVPISAHPKIIDDDVYNVSVFNMGFFLHKNGKVILFEIFPDMKQYYFHDFAITENYFIFHLNSVNIDFPELVLGNKTILESVSMNKNNKYLFIHRTTLQRTYVNIPDEYDFNSLHVADVKEYGDDIVIHMCLMYDSFDISKVENAHDFKGCYLHRITFYKLNITEIKRITNIHCEMPVVYKDYIFLINAHNILKYNMKTKKITLKPMGEQIMEEPVIHDGYLFTIGHIQNDTIISIFDCDTLQIVKKDSLGYNTSYGFHGLFIPSAFNASV